MLWCFFLSSHYSWRHKSFLYILRHGAKVGYCRCWKPVPVFQWTTHGYANSRSDNSLTGHSGRLINSQTGQLADPTGDFVCVLNFRFLATYWCFLACVLSTETYFASDSVSCIICPQSLIVQLKQQVLLPAASTRSRVVQSTTCPVHELTSPWDVQSASWQSASWHICELSSYLPTLVRVSLKLASETGCLASHQQNRLLPDNIVTC